MNNDMIAPTMPAATPLCTVVHMAHTDPLLHRDKCTQCTPRHHTHPTRLTIPPHVTAITPPEEVPTSLMMLTRVVLAHETRLAKIANHTFRNLSSLQHISLEASAIVQIPPYCFAECRALTNVRLPDTVRTIGFLAFSGCTKLTTFRFPAHLEMIGQEAFAAVPLVDIDLSLCTSLQCVRRRAFSTCGAPHITLPPFVELPVGIDESAFGTELGRVHARSMRGHYFTTLRAIQINVHSTMDAMMDVGEGRGHGPFATALATLPYEMIGEITNFL
jgi:hypothetical protein